MAAKHLFFQNWKRLLFILGVCTGGYMLLFFGYVENYSVLSLAVVAFLLVGPLIVENDLPVWWSLLPFVLAVSMHLFGLILVPGLIFILLRRTKMGKSIRLQSTLSKIVILAALVLIGVVGYLTSRHGSYFYSFTLLPWIPDRFTVDDNYIFSLRHQMNVFNLLFMMLPALLLAIIILPPRMRELRAEASITFVLFVLIPSIFVIYTFNPKLGMPRDWDLFAVVGPPIVIFFFFSLLKYNQAGKFSGRMAVLAIILGFIILIPRAFSQIVPSVALAHFEDYVRLDPERNRTAWALLEHCPGPWPEGKNINSETAAMKKDLPADRLVMEGRLTRSTGDLHGAAGLFRKAIDQSPAYADAWANLGECYMKMKRLDSALVMLQIAHGLSPYNANTLNNLGSANFYLQRYADAARYWTQAAAIDTSAITPRMNLVQAYYSLKDQAKYAAALKDVGARPDARLT